MPRPLRVLYVFTARKTGLLAGVQRGEAPDTLLFGLNHLASQGIEADFYEPEYGTVGRAMSKQLGRLGPDVLQLRTLPQFKSYDLVFLTGGWPLLLASRVLRQPGRPKMVWLNMTLTNLLRRPGPMAPLIASAVKQADRVVCVAQMQRTYLMKRVGIPEMRLPLVLSGTDANFFRAAHVPGRAQILGREAAGQRVLAAGRDAGRDYRTMFEALRDSSLHARLVCSPSNLSGLDVPPNVQVRFDIPPVELRDEYASASMVVIPTQGDSSVAGSDCSGTLVLLDALAMGLPCVISDRASVHDYVVAGKHTAVVPPGDPMALRQEMVRHLEDASHAADMARTGREHVHQHLTTAHFAARLADVFRQTMEER
ncbi:MAG TPA: glycosyltransferase family 4 protein [Chloroflexota bacterium]|nr:glycosyltransferase family 4 protein [Chloroflexota bacterium]